MPARDFEAASRRCGADQKWAKRLLLAMWALAAAGGMLGMPTPARADDEGPPPHDARLDGYAQDVTVKGGSAGTYLALIIVIGLPIGVMFMDAKRSHLD
jgi:hypothetical protein